MSTAKLWTRNFRLVILASAMGTLGSIAGGFALAFLVFDETGSTLASALIVAIQLIPNLLLPILIAPVMDMRTIWRCIMLSFCPMLCLRLPSS